LCLGILPEAARASKAGFGYRRNSAASLAVIEQWRRQRPLGSQTLVSSEKVPFRRVPGAGFGPASPRPKRGGPPLDDPGSASMIAESRRQSRHRMPPSALSRNVTSSTRFCVPSGRTYLSRVAICRPQEAHCSGSCLIVDMVAARSQTRESEIGQECKTIRSEDRRSSPSDDYTSSQAVLCREGASLAAFQQLVLASGYRTGAIGGF
jgi:hypothetical protein